MKLSKTLCYMSFIVIAAFLMPVLADTPLGQIDSLDDIAGTGWTEVNDTNLMRQELDPNNVYEGIGGFGPFGILRELTEQFSRLDVKRQVGNGARDCIGRVGNQTLLYALFNLGQRALAEPFTLDTESAYRFA